MSYLFFVQDIFSANKTIAYHCKFNHLKYFYTGFHSDSVYIIIYSGLFSNY